MGCGAAGVLPGEPPVQSMRHRPSPAAWDSTPTHPRTHPTHPTPRQVSRLSKNIDRLLETASRRLNQEDGDWVDVLQSLESARGVVKGNGPGGDL